nr:IS1 family transposase [Okeania sp. SIO2C2]
MPNCPQCHGQPVVKNGQLHKGKQPFKCHHCGRQLIEHPTQNTISEQTQAGIDPMLLERISLTAIARVAQLSEKWLQDHVLAKYAEVPPLVKTSPKKKGKLTLPALEMWSFVDNKGNQQWVWVGLDQERRQIVGVDIGKPDREAAKELWSSLPGVDRQCAIVYTDFWQADEQVVPSKRHGAVGQQTGQTSYIERFNCTIRQGVSRLVSTALSCCQKLENHIGAIWMFIDHYNA